MAGLPSGVVTFVFTDIEASTPLFERLGDAYRPLQERHRALLRAAWNAHGGHEIGTEGDGFFVAFADPEAAVRACVDGQRALVAEHWPPDAVIRVRMGVHTGAAEPVDGNYTSLAVNAASRVMAAGNGGQIVVTEGTRSLTNMNDVRFVDVGPQRLRGISEPLRLFLVHGDGMAADERPLRTSRVATTNLVVPDDELVGRDDEVAELATLLQRHRVLTITGTGGVGKTRLALAAAASVGADFTDGVWFVDLHAVRHDDEVVAAVGRLLQAATTDDPLTGVVDAIADQRVLIVLDNCEHLITPARRVAEAIARNCPAARVLVTSREPLGLAAETTWRAPSLADDVAITLLRKRIADARGGSEPSDDDVEHLHTIAARLDGIPLALELAAARCGAMTAADVAARLTQRFRLLTGGRGSLSRHQTLEAAVAWSVDLLDETTRAVFRRLAVFVGGWTLDAAEAVASIGIDAFDVDDALHALVEKSLVHADLSATPARYSFLETMRDYAYAELVRAGEADEVHTRHVGYFVALGRELDEAIPGPTESAAVLRFDAEAENVQIALEWALSTGDVEAAANLVADASDPGVTVGRAVQMVSWVERVLAAIEDSGNIAPDLHARVLVASARISYDHMHGFEDALPRLRRAWEMVRDTPDPSVLVRAVCAGWLADFLLEAGEIDEGIAFREQSAALLVERPAMRAVFLALLGQERMEYTSEGERGRRELAEALGLAEQSQSVRGECIARTALAWDAAMRGDRDACERVALPLLETAAGMPDVPAVDVLGRAARSLIAVGSYELAERISADAVRIATRSGNAEAVVDASFTAGSVAAAGGDMAAAEREWTMTAELASRLGRPFYAMLSRYRLGWLMEERGDSDGERRMLEEAKPFAFRLGWMPRIAWSMQYGQLELRAGNKPAARAHLRDAIDQARISRAPFQIGALLTALADTCFEAERLEDAVRLMAFFRQVSTEAQLRTTGSTMRYRRTKEREARLLETFDSAHHDRLVAEGRAWTLADVEALVDDVTA